MKHATIFHANLRHGARFAFEARGFRIDLMAGLRRMNPRRGITDFTTPL